MLYITMGELRRLVEAGTPMPKVRQETEWTCGPAAVKAIVKAMRGRDLPEDEIVDISDADSEQGTSPADLLKAFEELGMPAHRRDRLSVDDLRGHIRDGCPVILDVDMWGGEHWVVAHACNDKFFRLMDPSTDRSVIMSPGALDGIRWSSSKGGPRGGIVVASRGP